MKKIKVITTLLLATISFSYAQQLTGDEILKKIDDNLILDEAVSHSKMVIHSRTGTRTVESRSWVRGKNKAFVEYLNPPRERGNKMLKLDDKIWNYIPEPTDRIITISGHLLKQSVMGSDLSYEDMTENDPLIEVYNSKIIGSEKINDVDCYVLELTAKEEGTTYYSRKLWVDKSNWLPRRQELYAKSGKLLKWITIDEVFKVGKRWYPKKMVFKDALSKGEGTEYYIEDIDFNVDIPDYKFTKAALRQ